jgi:hypothetical protein
MSPHKNRGCRSLRNYQRMGPVWYPMLSPMGPTLGPIWCPMVVLYHKRRNSVRFVELLRYVNIRNMPNPFKTFIYIYIYIYVCCFNPLEPARATSALSYIFWMEFEISNGIIIRDHQWNRKIVAPTSVCPGWP